MSEPQQLADGVVRLGTPIVNWYLVADDSGVTVVDAAVAGYSDQLEPGLKLLGRSLDDVRAFVLTHGDGDHVGVAAKMQKDGDDTPIHLHPADQYLVQKKRKKIEDPMLPLLVKPGAWRLFGHLSRFGVLSQPKIDHTVDLSGGESLDVPGQPRVIGTPGHTRATSPFTFRNTGRCSLATRFAPGTRSPGSADRGRWPSTCPTRPRSIRFPPTRNWTRTWCWSAMASRGPKGRKRRWSGRVRRPDRTRNRRGGRVTRTQTASEQITEEVTSWPGVTAGPGRRGEFAFKLGKREIGHLHGDHAAHFSFPKQVWVELRGEGRIGDHPVFPGKQGPAARGIEDEADVRDVIELMRLNYERIVARHGLPAQT